jgi:hypothetical protein
MSGWTYGNSKAVLRSFDVFLSETQTDAAIVSVQLDADTLKWNAEILLPGSEYALEIPEDVKLSARSPSRAAARALEHLLEMIDRGEVFL